MNQENISNPWDFFDRIYCISLSDREDRREEAHRQFTLLGIASKTRYMIVKRHPTNSEQGIYTSHQTCLMEGLDSGAKHIAVFEDDVIFHRYDKNRLNDCLSYLKSKPDWFILYFGCLVKRSRATESDAVRAVDYHCLSHGYAVSRSGARRIVEKRWKNIPYDGMLRSLTGPHYSVYPMFAFQSNATTDNAHCRRIDRFRRWCGGLQGIQKANEWYHTNKGVVVALHIVALMLLAWIVFG